MNGKRLFFSDFNGSLRAIDWTQVHKPMEKMARRIRLQMYIWGFESNAPVLKGTVWRFRRRSESFQGTPSISGEAVYVPSLQGNVYKISSSEGKLLWKYSMNSRVTHQPTVYGDVIYVSDDLGKIHGVSVLTGDVVWKLTLEGTKTSPVVVAEETMFVVTNVGGKGVLSAIK